MQTPRTFGRRKAPHTITVATGDRVRQFTVRPGLALGAAGLVGALCLGVLGSAGYLLLNDDLVAVAMSRNETLKQAYEQRISSLRAQLDQVTTRQILARELVETKVETLLDQQEELADQFQKLRPILERAHSTGLLPADDAAADAQVDMPPGSAEHFGALGFTNETNGPDPLARFGLVTGTDAAGDPTLAPDGAVPIDELRRAVADTSAIPGVVEEIEAAVEEARVRQVSELGRLAESARARSTRIVDTLRLAGIEIDEAEPEAAQGGLYEPLPAEFDARVADLDEALTTLQHVSSQVAAMPLAAPTETGVRSSGFGVRRDPFLGTSALHAGVDFAAPSGTPVLATAAGTVVTAGTSGGYGRMVEIDHGDGITTRFAHLSSIDVAVGDAVEVGTTLGGIGSTGRSTGPHLHYEIRRDGAAVDPDRFLKAGRHIAELRR